MTTKFIRFTNANGLRDSLYNLSAGDIVLFGNESFNCGKDWEEKASIASMEWAEFYIANGRKFDFASYSSGSHIWAPKGYGKVTEINSRGFRVEVL